MDSAREEARSQAPATISWKRVRATAVHELVVYLGVMAAVVLFVRVCGGLIEVELGNTSRGHKDPAVLEGFVLALWFGVAAFSYAGGSWLGPARVRQLMGGRKAIARAPHDGSTLVLVEGRVSCPAHGSPRLAPITGRPCLYYRVGIDQRKEGDDRSQPSESHWERWIAPLVVTDESGFVLVDCTNRDLQKDDPVEATHHYFSNTTEHDSRSGIYGLPPEAVAYVQKHPKEITIYGNATRLRVIEHVIREGDVITLIGAIQTREVPVDAYRSASGGTSLVMDSSPAGPLYLIPASLADLRRLIAIQRRITIALVVATVLALGHAGLGILRMVAR